MHARRALLLALVFAVSPALASDNDAAALSLADKTVGEARLARDWHGSVTTGLSRASWREPFLQDRDNTQLFAHLRYDTSLSREWRVVFADFLTLQRHEDLLGRHSVNTLIDAYASWQPRADRIVDVGRINTRLGVAHGFNPTDYFRANAIRSVVSIDPSSLRVNRQGSVMVRGQALWPSGSATAIYSPRLANRPSEAGFSADFGATNSRDRWLLAIGQRVGEDVDPQVLLHGGAGESPQLGLNVTALLGEATIAYAEASMGRSPTQLARALGMPSEAAFRSQWVTGLTHTTPGNVTLTLEFEYNGAGLDRAALDALTRGPFASLLALYPRYRLFTARIQSPPTKQRTFASALWTDAFVDRLNLAAFAYYDHVDASRQLWVEARYRSTFDVDTALQWQRNSGASSSAFGVLPARQVWQVLATWYF